MQIFPLTPPNQMKTTIAVTLIIMGTLLILTPVLSDLYYQRSVHDLATGSQNNGTFLEYKVNVLRAAQMGDLYRFGCWLTGSGMVGISVFASLFSARQPQEQSRLMPQVA